MYIVISYDVKSDKRRNKMHKALKDYGAWVQYSVFECNVKEKDFVKLRHRLKKLLSDEEDDSLCFYKLCEECRKRIERITGLKPPDHSTVIVKK